MVRAKLRALADSTRDRIPDPPAVETPAVGDRLPDADAIGRAATLLVAAGSALAGVGLLLRLVLRRRSKTDQEPEPPAPTPAETDTTPDPTWDWEGPRVAPLVGLCGLVAMRQFVEWLGGDRTAGES